jgi:hypothetical protein
MKKNLQYFFFLLFLVPVAAKAQFETYKDSVVQVYGVIMSSDSLKALPSVSVMVKGRNQGTISSEQGVFVIPLLRGDVIEFTSVGYKPKQVTIPQNLVGNEQSMIQLMVEDTVYLPATIIKRRPTREEFERDFVTASVPNDQQEIARENLSESNLRALMATYPKDGREATNYYLKQNAQKYYSAGQLPPQNIFNPLAWAEFIKAWKRGDFKQSK